MKNLTNIARHFYGLNAAFIGSSVSSKTVRAQIFAQTRVIGAQVRVSTRSKFQTLMVKSHVLDVKAGGYIHVICEVQSNETNHHVFASKK